MKVRDVLKLVVAFCLFLWGISRWRTIFELCLLCIGRFKGCPFYALLFWNAIGTIFLLWISYVISKSVLSTKKRIPKVISFNYAIWDISLLFFALSIGSVANIPSILIAFIMFTYLLSRKRMEKRRLRDLARFCRCE